ncbi:MAG: exosortase E/protease, VPEID-CTERM system [Candidatus Xenobia bacterium]
MTLTPSTRRWAIGALALVAESEILVVRHYAVRTGVRALLHLPLYHILLAFLAFAVILRYLAASRMAPLPATRWSPGFLAAHCLLSGFLQLYVTRVWLMTQASPGLRWLWFPLMAAYFGTWLGSILPIADWWLTLRAHGGWMASGLVLGSLSVLLADGAERLWVPLSRASFTLSFDLLRLWFKAPVADPQHLILGTHTFQIQILPGCSGFEGMGLIALFMATYLWVRRRELWWRRAWWLLPLALLLSWVLNSVRLALLVAVGTRWSPAVAIRGFHSQVGWLAFTLLGLMFIVLLERTEWFRRKSARSEDGDHYPALAFLLPLFALLLAGIGTAAFYPDFDLLYPARILIAAILLFASRRSYRGLFGTPSASGCLVGGAVYLAWSLLAPGWDNPSGDAALILPGLAGVVWMFCRLAGSVLVIPLVEELAFRGYLLRRLQASHFDTVPVGRLTPWSVLVSSLIFGLMHQAHWVAGFVSGLAFAWCTRKGDLMDAVVAHGTANLCLGLQVLLLDHWSLWG